MISLFGTATFPRSLTSTTARPFPLSARRPCCGGTRTASITGGYVALVLALKKLQKDGVLQTLPLLDSVSAISCGICGGVPCLDLDYEEDSSADTDSNFVITGSGKLVEIQGTAEHNPFSEDEFLTLLSLAKAGCSQLKTLQEKALQEA